MIIVGPFQLSCSILSAILFYSKVCPKTWKFMWVVSTRSAAATWKEDQEEAHLPITEDIATLPPNIIFILLSTDSTPLLLQQIFSVQMSTSHQIFRSPLKNQHPIYFLTNHRKQGVLQEKHYITARSSAALSPCSSGMLR